MNFSQQVLKNNLKVYILERSKELQVGTETMIY